MSILSKIKEIEQEIENAFDHPVLGIPDQENHSTSPNTEVAAVVQALKDITPYTWQPNHPQANLFAAAHKAIAAYEGTVA